MKKNISFGKFLPGDSFVHNLDPRIKLIVSFLIFFTVFFVKKWFCFFMMIFLVLFLMKLSRIPMKTYFKSIKPIIIMAFVASVINIIFEFQSRMMLHNNIKFDFFKNSTVMFFRILVLALSGTLISFTTSPQNISFSLEKIMTPFKYIGINVQELSLTMTIALRFLPILFDEANKIIVSQASRGAEFKSKNIFKKIKAYSNILVPLFISAFKKADFLAESMESRCYDINSKRTRFKNPSLTKSDVLFAGLMILMSIGVIVCDLIINF